ncbi:MAG: CHAP domain-containing protein [Bifidobacterium sp.]|jgi:surface antigen|nr:CHAP domain-containing protein [Bifidobacterium sp.]MCI1864839.1 CHAP domain-containing protein [Bifidobacterium sp.]
MRHAAHRAAKVSHKRAGVSATFMGGHGSHTSQAVYARQAADHDGAVVGLDSAVADRLNEIIPPTRRSMRQSARAAQRRSYILGSTSLAALVGTAATAMAFASPKEESIDAVQTATTTSQLRRVSGSTVSRSQERADLHSSALAEQTSNSGNWQLGGSDSAIDVSRMSRSLASNPVVASYMQSDQSVLPKGFNPNHATGDSGNAYEFSQCTWWVYVRRHQLGLPVGSHMGNGNMWASSARALGYWVDNTPRHVGDIMVFAAGQDGADASYGHVAIVEKINSDGSITTSECGAVLDGKTISRTFSASQTGSYQFIHY